MSNKNLFNIFLVSVLVLVGVYFVVGGNAFTTPANNITYITGNYTVTLVVDSAVVGNPINLTLYNVTRTWSDSTGEPLTGWTALDRNNTIQNVTNTSLQTFTFTLYTGNLTNGLNGRGDGNYTFTAMVANVTNVRSYVNFTVLVDNNPPSALYLVYPRPNETYVNNGTIQFGFNVTDGMSGNWTYGNKINCSLFIDNVLINSSITVDNTTYETPVTSSRGAAYWFNVTATSFAAEDGYHIWNVTCRDKANNLNNSASWVDGYGYQRNHGNFTLTDTVGPTTNTPTFSASSVVKDVAVTVTCTGTDTIDSTPLEYVSVKAPNGAWQEDLGTSPHSFTGTNTAGTWTSRCRSRDSAGNTGAFGSEATFAVTTATSNSDSTSTSGSSSSSSKPVKVVAYAGQTQDLGSLATSAGGEGIINAYQSSTVTFSVTTSSESSSSSHSVRFDEVSYIDGTVTVTISSDPIILTLGVGDVETVDLEGDGVDDLQVTLNSIDSNGKADMTVKDLVAIIVTETTEDTTGAEETVTGSGGGLGAIWWILIIVVIIVIVVLVLPKKKRK